MKPILLALLLLAPLAAAKETPPPASPRLVEAAICLDTSGSMQGLIDAARRKLWSIVNDLALARPTPRLRVALLTFGNDGHDAESGWVRVDSPLTEDLDAISQRLFALTTNGGTELVGRVVDAATKGLDWSGDPATLKLLFVAGNESADQDQQVRYADACKRAIEKGILVNSIYCGDPNDEIAPGWQDVARRADGQYMAIDQNAAATAIPTPFDEKLAALSTSLNETYVPIGSEGFKKKENQAAQDANAASLSPSAAAERCEAKKSALYRCQWDLVDAFLHEGLKLEELKPEDLPEDLRGLDAEKLRLRIEEFSKRRGALQAEIGEIQAKRQAFLAEEQKKLTAAGERLFDDAIRSAIRSQAEKKGFVFEK
jgi:hypothetical protein